MLEEPSIREHIYWSENGLSFVVANSNRFASLVLPHHFKHSNFVSFVRQLNLYGFKKNNRSYHRRDVVSLEERLSKPQEFSHSHFKRDHKHLLANIRRKSKAKLVSTVKVIKRPKYDADSDDSDLSDFSDSESEMTTHHYKRRKSYELSSRMAIATSSLESARLIDHSVRAIKSVISPPIPPSPKLDLDLLVRNQTLLQSNITNLEARLSNSLREIKSISTKFEQAFGLLVRADEDCLPPRSVPAPPHMAFPPPHITAQSPIIAPAAQPIYSQPLLPPHPQPAYRYPQQEMQPYRVWALPVHSLDFEHPQHLNKYNKYEVGSSASSKYDHPMYMYGKTNHQLDKPSLKIENLLNPIK